MLHSTYETTKALLKTDPSISSQERNRILKLIQSGGESSDEKKEPARILRRREAAARLSISLRALDNWARDGLITKIILPGKSRACGFSSTEIDALVEGQK